MYSINFTVTKKKFCLSLHYNEANIYLFVNGKEILKFKSNDSSIVATPLCLRNISKDCSINDMKKTGLDGYVHEFFVDYVDFNTSPPINIAEYLLSVHRYFMLKYKTE